jgi:hypothetical protein
VADAPSRTAIRSSCASPCTRISRCTSVAADTRLSAQVYLQMSDVERVGDLVLQLLGEAAECRGGGSNSSSSARSKMAKSRDGCDWVLRGAGTAKAPNATAQQRHGGDKREKKGDASCAGQFL